jgi:hypothetical protein
MGMVEVLPWQNFKQFSGEAGKLKTSSGAKSSSSRTARSMLRVDCKEIAPQGRSKTDGSRIGFYEPILEFCVAIPKGIAQNSKTKRR